MAMNGRGPTTQFLGDNNNDHHGPINHISWDDPPRGHIQRNLATATLGCPVGSDRINGDRINGLVITDPYKWGIPWGEKTH